MIKRRRTVIGIAVLLVLIGAVGPHAYGWYELRRASSQLSNHEPEAAAESLGRCRKVWDGSVEAWVLSSRAARQSGDTVLAEKYLREAHRLAGDSLDMVAFEWALHQATIGNVWEVDEYLQSRADARPEHGPLVWEALAEGYLRLYRILDAMATLNHWLERVPHDSRALELRGITYVTGKGVQRGAEDFRKALEVAPNHLRTRKRLADALLDLGSFEEAVPHLQVIIQRDSSNIDAMAQLARCQNMLGQPSEARQLLDSALDQSPENGPALRARGQFALADGDPVLAEKYLRRAARVQAHDYQTQYLLFQAIQRQEGRSEEAAAQLRLADEEKDLSERLGELRSRKLAERPLDPALHTEMGILLLRTDSVEAGEIWLGSALALRPDYPPAHAALAEHYSRQGATAKAAFHRSRLGFTPKSKIAK